jgi:hypothetical protein
MKLAVVNGDESTSVRSVRGSIIRWNSRPFRDASTRAVTFRPSTPKLFWASSSRWRAS